MERIKMQYKTAELKGLVNDLENFLENGGNNHVNETVMEIGKVSDELKSFIGFNVPVSGQLPREELREHFHDLWTDNSMGIYSKKKWQEFSKFFMDKIGMEV